MLPYLLLVLVLLVITLIYAAFDVFNKRNIPDAFVYAACLLALIITFTYDINTVYISLAITIFISAIGYIIYRKGLLGAGDVFEFITISLIFPLQPQPLIQSSLQFQLPQVFSAFVFSVFIVSGYVSAITIIIYYLLFAKKTELEKKVSIEKRKIILGISLLTAYLFLIYALNAVISLNIPTVVLLLLIAIPSSIMIIYEKLINARMLGMVYPKALMDGDMIAVNFMSGNDIRYFRKKSKSFGRLATNKLISEIKNVKKKIPVYRNAAPLALFILIGVIVALVFGNIIAYLI